MIYGTIDFDTDADGKHLTKEDYMAEGYDFQQYLDSHAPHSTAPKSLKEEQEEKRSLHVIFFDDIRGKRKTTLIRTIRKEQPKMWLLFLFG